MLSSAVRSSDIIFEKVTLGRKGSAGGRHAASDDERDRMQKVGSRKKAAFLKYRKNGALLVIGQLAHVKQ